MIARRPKSVWVVFDPLDGPHLFRSASEAWEAYEKWGIEARDKQYDSFWEMSEPTEYIRKD